MFSMATVFFFTYIEYLFSFIFFSFILSFWGKYLLYLCIQEKKIYFDVSTISAGLSAYLLIAHTWVIYFKLNLLTLNYLFIIVAIAGIIVHGAYVLWTNPFNLSTLLSLLQNKYLLSAILFSSILICIFLFSSKDGTMPFIWIINNDGFNWAIHSDIYRNIFKTENMVTNPHVLYDALGSCFTLGLSATFFQKLSMLAITKSTFICMVWIGLGVMQCVHFIFSLRLRYASIIALLIITSPALDYIAFNYFWGQLLAMFFFYPFILALLSNCKNTFCKCFCIFFPLVGLFLVYQSGFVVFAFVAVCVVCIIVFFSYTSFEIKKSMQCVIRKVVLPLTYTFLFTCAILPKMTVHFFERALTVVSIDAGWTLFLLNPFMLLSLPGFSDFTQKSSYIWYAIYFISCLLGIFYCYKYKAMTNKRYIYVGLLSLLSLFLLLYFIEFTLLGSRYQTWKLVTFTVLPLSFIPLSIGCCIIQNLYKENPGYFSKPLYITFFVCIVGLGLFSAGYRFALRDNRISYSLMHQIIELQSLCYKDEPIILDLDFSHTLLAAALLLDKNPLYPLNVSYLPVASESMLAGLPENVRTIGFDLENPFRNHSKKKLYFRNADYGKSVISGMYPSENWGCWGRGQQSQVVFLIPQYLRGTNFSLDLFVQPFLTPVVSSQTLGISVNKREYGSVAVTAPAKITIPVPAGSGATVTLDFYHPNGISPQSLDPKNQDLRLLSVGFVDIQIAAQE